MLRQPATITHGLARLVATTTLLAAIVGLPLALVRVVGMPERATLAAALRTGRLDDGAVVQIGTAVFLVLWAWFALTALTEVARIVAWRGRSRRAPLQPITSSPSGWIRRAVRLAMIGSSSLIGTGLLTVATTPGATAVHAAAPFPSSAAPAHQVTGRVPSNIVSSGRDTPYSIAVRLGDPGLRDRIIELNRGAAQPDGATWTNGVFPAGMPVAVPEGSLAPPQHGWTTYTVVAGDSVYRIAARLSAGDGRRVREIADEIITRNLGRTMNDGFTFEDPSLIRIGWQIEVPDLLDAAPTQVAGDDAGQPAHVVEPGESYWSIAEAHLRETGEPATGPAIAALTDELVQINDPLLGHRVETLIVPGDEVRWPPIEVTVPAAPPAPPVAAPADAPADGPPVTTVPVDAETTTSLRAATPEPAIAGTTTTGVASTAAPVTSGNVAPGERPSATDDTGTRRGSPVSTSLGATILLAAGALGLVEARRRHQLRRAPERAVLEHPTDRDLATERLLRTLPAAERALRLDLALRSAGHHIAGTGAHVQAATMTESGTITLILHRPERAAPATPWRADPRHPGRWLLPDSVDNEQLIDSARLAGQPCPSIVHLGSVVGDVDEETALFVDLEAFGLTSIEGDPVSTRQIVAGIATSLAASPVGETLRLVTHDLSFETHLGNLNAEAAETVDAAIDCAASALGSTPTAIGGRRTFELRARGVGGEAWEPVVVVSGADHHEGSAVHDLAAVTQGGGRGLAAVLIGPVDGAALRLTADADGWSVAALGMRVLPVGLDDEQIAAVHSLLDAADRPLAVAEPKPTTRAPHEPFAEQPWQLVVRVLGQVSVTDRDGVPVAFERGKALELAAWLATHRERPTRAGARTALWDLSVRDATFANVVSDARRAMARAVEPPAGEEWLERTLTEHLPLHQLVASDADLLRARLDAARGVTGRDAIELLRPGIAWITDMPFAGTNYLWPDAEGITSSLTLLATAAATEMARACLQIGDVEGVFWATGRGLQVLPGHEELIGLRMRAYAQRGDLAGVRGEWEVYERAIHADPWSSGEPSPKLVAIRRELLAR